MDIFVALKICLKQKFLFPQNVTWKSTQLLHWKYDQCFTHFYLRKHYYF